MHHIRGYFALIGPEPPATELEDSRQEFMRGRERASCFGRWYKTDTAPPMIRATETKATRSIYKVMLRVEAYRARRGCSGRVFGSMVFFFMRSLPSVCLPLAKKSFKILCVPVRGGGGDGGSTFDRRTNTVRTPSTEAGKAIFLPPLLFAVSRAIALRADGFSAYTNDAGAGCVGHINLAGGFVPRR